MAVTVEILPAAQRRLDAADERWVDEHGLFADNPLFVGTSNTYLDELLKLPAEGRSQAAMPGSGGASPGRHRRPDDRGGCSRRRTGS